MKSYSPAERILIEEVMQSALKLRTALRGLKIGALIKSIRKQLGMSQKVLAQRAHIPQSTISRVEKDFKEISFLTLNKILKALSCELIITPLLHVSIDEMRRKQAEKIADKRLQYLKGTMNLEEQQPDSKFIETLYRHEVEQLLHDPSSKLWEE